MRKVFNMILNFFKSDNYSGLQYHAKLNKFHEEKRKNYIPKFFTETEISEFRENLLLTINWVDKLIVGHNFNEGDNNRILRQTNPIIGGAALYKFNDKIPKSDLNFELYSYEDYSPVLKEALKVRTQDKHVKSKNIESKGRILCFQTGVTTHDGAPVMEGKGFVDTYDIPPIDTWIYLKFEFDTYNNSTLFCWIPKEAEEVMQNIIDVEFLGSYNWLNEKYPALYKSIKECI